MQQHLITYKTYQQRIVELHTQAVDWGMNYKQVFQRAARKLGMLGGENQFVFSHDSEMDILMDGLLYEEKVEQRKVIVGFLAGYTCKDEIDRQLARAMRNTQLGLYRIETVDAERAKIALTALLPEMMDTTMVNINLAKTAKAKAILALRILDLPEFSICSGVMFPFQPGKEQRLIREWWKKQGLERYAHFFKLSKKEEITTIFR